MDLKQLDMRGKHGYIDMRKKSLLIRMLLCAGLFAVLLLIGYLIFHNIRNILMVPAMLMVIPLANFVASYAAMYRFRTGSEEQYSMLAHYYEQGMLMSDLIFVTEDGSRYMCDYAVIYRGGIVGYASDATWRPNIVESHVNGLLRKRGVPLNLKIYNDFDEFLKRIDGVTPPAEEDARNIELARETIINTCM